MADDKALTIPVRTELVTKEVIDQAYEFYQGLAIQALEGMRFKNAEEKEAEVARTILQLVESTDTINDNVRQRAINVIARYCLYHYTPEGWGTLTDMIRDAAPSLSPSALCEFMAINETIIPYCETHDIELEMPPDRLGYLREAASALRQVIQGPLPNGEKTGVIQTELNWLFNEAPSRDGPDGVRDRYRKWRGLPAQGIMGTHNDTTVVVLMATSATAAALRQKIGRLATWDLPVSLTIREGTGTMVPSKLNNGQFIQDHVTVISLSHTIVIDGETGEVIEGNGS
jgi:hypothetical protein